jgi:2-polyprenyl-3-methyl-5-hydroxy-6-metoxy-1,4-benzoquinol methylase
MGAGANGSLEPTAATLHEVWRLKYGDFRRVGWGPHLRLRFRYYTPDDYYEALVMRLARGSGSWLDIGCGRNIFPDNGRLAELLVKSCGRVVGVDCDDTLDENPYIHERVKCPMEQYTSDRPFDLVTLRMVAEHIAEPAAALAALARVTRPGSAVVVYTPNRWSPVSLMAWLVPFRFHHAVKHWLWGTEEQDTFPVEYKMNTRGALRRQFQAAGFRESYFRYLDDCRTLARFKATHLCELAACRMLNLVGIHYPENCLLGVYVKA